MGIHEDLQDFGRGIARIHKTLGEDSWGFMRLGEDLQGRVCEDLPDFGRGFVRLWERIHKTLEEDS